MEFKFFKYAESKILKNKIEFGWIKIEKDGIKYPVLVSLGKDSSRVSSLEDSTKYFKSSTNLSPKEFLSRWKGKEEELKSFWKSNFSEAKGEHYLFMLSLAELLENHKEFSMYDSIYKIILDEQTLGAM